MAITKGTLLAVAVVWKGFIDHDKFTALTTQCILYLVCCGYKIHVIDLCFGLSENNTSVQKTSLVTVRLVSFVQMYVYFRPLKFRKPGHAHKTSEDVCILVCTQRWYEQLYTG